MKEPHIWTIAHDPGRLGSPDWWRRNVPREPSWWRRTFVEPFRHIRAHSGTPSTEITIGPPFRLMTQEEFAEARFGPKDAPTLACPDCGRPQPLHWPWCVQTPSDMDERVRKATQTPRDGA